MLGGDGQEEEEGGDGGALGGAKRDRGGDIGGTLEH